MKRMVELAELQGDDTVYDLGCGDARLLIEAKKRFPGIVAIGYELPVGVWLLAKLRVFLSRQKVIVRLGDFRNSIKRWTCLAVFNITNKTPTKPERSDNISLCFTFFGSDGFFGVCIYIFRLAGILR